jgi:uncharacterized membrane protein YebE (DUF533 family)
MNPLDILGAVMQSGLAKGAGDQMGAVLGEMMGRMAGGSPAPGAAPGAAPGMGGGNMLDMLAKAAGAILGGGQGGAPAGSGTAAGGTAGAGDLLGQLAGAVLGGSGAQGNAGAGLGSMAVFGTLAAKALELAKGMMGAPAAAGGAAGGLDGLSAVLAGLRPPTTPQEQQQFLDLATLTLKAMITAAKADGRLDDQERERLLGKLNEGGITSAEQRFVDEEMQKPIDLDALVRAVPNEQVAAQVYAASLMTITIDTDPERRYMADLAARLRLDPQVVANLHRAVGLA